MALSFLSTLPPWAISPTPHGFTHHLNIARKLVSSLGLAAVLDLSFQLLYGRCFNTSLPRLVFPQRLPFAESIPESFPHCCGLNVCVFPQIHILKL